MAEKAVARRTPKAELVQFGKRALSTGGWRTDLVREHLETHLGATLSEQWCKIDCMARTFFLRNTQSTRQQVRHRLPRMFRLFLSDGLFIVIEYAQGKGTHGEALACKILRRDRQEEREYATVQLERMRKRGDLTATQLAAARELVEAGDDS